VLVVVDIGKSQCPYFTCTWRMQSKLHISVFSYETYEHVKSFEPF